MPIDAEGNRAELIMDGESTIRRTNLGRLYEQYFNATSRTVTNYVRRMMANDPKSVAHCFEYLKGYYKICTPPMYDLLTSPSYQGTPAYHVESVIKEGVYLNLPTDNPAEYPVAIRQLRKEYPTLIGPVTYRGRSGNLVTTRDPVLIGSLYIMLLEKTGVDWSAVDSAKLNCFGIPARLTNRDKHSAPGRQMPVRLTGEDEVRLFAATIGGDATAEMMEMSNNPTTHKHIVTNILHAKQPTNIENVVNRSVVPRGNSRPLIFIRHMLQSCGIILKYNPIENQPDSIYVGPNTKADGPLMGVIPREDD